MSYLIGRNRKWYNTCFDEGKGLTCWGLIASRPTLCTLHFISVMSPVVTHWKQMVIQEQKVCLLGIHCTLSHCYTGITCNTAATCMLLGYTLSYGYTGIKGTCVSVGYTISYGYIGAKDISVRYTLSYSYTWTTGMFFVYTLTDGHTGTLGGFLWYTVLWCAWDDTASELTQARTRDING
jgi:hypothetical protein